MTTQPTFATWLMEQRKSRDWSLADMQKVTGVSRAYLHRLENGYNSPSLDMLVMIAKGFGVGAGDLLVAAGYTVNDAEEIDKFNRLAQVDADMMIAQRYLARAMRNMKANTD